MLRRSERLQSVGCYSREGEPIISYKETLYTIFKSRRLRPRPGPDTADHDDVDSDYTIVSDSSRGLFGATKALGLLVLMLALCFGLIFGIGGPKMDFSTPFMSKLQYLMSEHEQVERQLQQLQREFMDIKKRMDFLLPVGDRMPNFALEGLGAKIVKEQSSASYLPEQSGLKLWGLTLIPAKPLCVRPRVVIQGRAPMVPGVCWSFAGSQGHLTVELSHSITISHVTLGHISKMVSPSGKISSAPRMFSVFGKRALGDSGVHLGTFLYDENGDPLQTFRIPDHKVDVIRYVTLHVLNNLGNHKYSCLYSFGVHGKLT
ncbi:SUN domain-containing protein 3-like isoform X2 [Oreochromis aureus]|uniref:SUN domain-containing protein n=1 Tax=Oreochromis aureus TaxID=47969 RepID=A0AAZ1XKJ3_OREAU|nr:SUN domain-containing protein 3-like isoform X2 [Oreochromis aureus]